MVHRKVHSVAHVGGLVTLYRPQSAFAAVP